MFFVFQTTSATPSRVSPDKRPGPGLAPPLEPFEYYDAGNHWCKNCNVTSGSMFDFFTHLHSKTHRKVCSSHATFVFWTVLWCRLLHSSLFFAQTLDPYDRPWASTPTKISKSMTSEEKLTKPAKGTSTFLTCCCHLSAAFAPMMCSLSRLPLPGGSAAGSVSK